MVVKSKKLSVNIGGLKLKNPIMVASGTFGYGKEYEGLANLNDIGAIITKSITLKPRDGNKPPRIWETTAGMLNAVGLQNNGVEDFIRNKIPYLKDLGVPIVVSIAGTTKQEYRELSIALDKTSVAGIEVNISCPSIEHKSKNTKLFSQDAKETASIIRLVKRNTKKPIIAKLSPNVSDITEIAKAAERAGADSLSLVNTLLGMAVDINTGSPRLGNVTGGLSGPCIKPIALRMVWEVYHSVKIPIIGIGGIMNAQDAIEFMLSGAVAIQLGTANFINPKVSTEVLLGLEKYITKKKIAHINDIVGTLKI